MTDQTSPVSETATLEQLQELQRRADIPHLPTQQTYEARLAVSREGPRAYDWEDKPHRIVYDLCREIERLSAGFAQTPAVPVSADSDELMVLADMVASMSGRMSLEDDRVALIMAATQLRRFAVADTSTDRECEHDWKVWPETDGQEQRCMKCGQHRRTPRYGTNGGAE